MTHAFFQPPEQDRYALRNLRAPDCLVQGVDLPPAGESAAIMKTFVTTSSVSASAELCQCTDRAVYPVWFGAYGVSDGASQLLGQTQTFVPSLVVPVLPPAG